MGEGDALQRAVYCSVGLLAVRKTKLPVMKIGRGSCTVHSIHRLFSRGADAGWLAFSLKVFLLT